MVGGRGGASWGEAKPRAHFCHCRQAKGKNTWRAEVYEAWCLACWLDACMDGLVAGWRTGGWLVGWLRVVVLKVGERLAGGTLARVYCEGTGLYDAL